MDRCLLSDGGFPKSPWEEMFFTAAFFVNRTPHKASEIETPCKRMHEKDANLGMLGAVGARAFVHVETYTQKLAQGLGRKTLRLQYGQSSLPYLQPNDEEGDGKQKRCFHRDPAVQHH